MSDLKDKPVSDRIPAPAKKWRNWYLAKEDLNWPERKSAPKAGEKYMGTDVHPSKEIAEQRASEKSKGKYEFSHIMGSALYLGAFPE